MNNEREIENLIYRYAELIDGGKLEQWSELFSHADYCGQDGSVLAHGAKAVHTMQCRYLRLYPDCGTPKTKHVTTNVIIELGDNQLSAVSRSYFTIFQATDELPLQPITAGRYNDVFEKADGRWRFKRRQIILELMGDLSKHLLIDVSDTVKTAGSD